MNAKTLHKHLPLIISSRRLIGSITVFACCFYLHLPPILAGTGSWTPKAPLPKAFGIHAACQVDGILYIVGGDAGTNVESHDQLKTLFAYDPKTDRWTPKQDMPTPRRFPAVAVVEGIIYVIGGGGVSDPLTGVVEAYDPKTDRWATKAMMRTPRWFHAACPVNGIIYTVGGVIGSPHNWTAVPTVEAYNPKTDQWTQKAKPPVADAAGAIQVVNGLIYAFYGKRTFTYDPTTDLWTPKSPVPAGWSFNCRLSASSVVDNIIYLFGGDSADLYTTYRFTLAYDPVQDQFTAKRWMSTNTLGATATTIGGKVYLAGGADRDPGAYTSITLYSNLWVFDPQGGVTPHLLSGTCESADRIKLTWQGEAGRFYGVQSTLDPVQGPWTRIKLTTGTNSIQATNDLVEGSCTYSMGDSRVFFRIIEAN